jgi:prepilin-type N-terminal cleavage/methylation domain-containing protein
MFIGSHSARCLRRLRGFTLVEVLVAIVAASILVLTGGAMLYFSYLGWQRDTNAVDMQQDGSAAMLAITRYVRAAQPGGLTAGGGVLTITTSNATVRISKSGSQLIFDPNTGVGGNELALVPSRVVSFTPVAMTNRVGVTLILQDGDITAVFTNTASPRN